MGSSNITNTLLLVVAILLLVNLAVPALDSAPVAPAPVERDPALGRLRADMEKLLQDLEVVVRLQAPAARPESPGRDAPDDALVVRIPGRLADEWGLTAEDVRTLIHAIAVSTSRQADNRPRSKEETAAIATLRNISSAQAQFQATARADVDRDGKGEFGCFVELSGAAVVRNDERKGRLNPPLLSGAFRTPDEAGLIGRSGYYYRMLLPDAGGGGVAADAVGTSYVDPDLAEKTWCLYAWPIHPGAGKRTFFLNQTGDVLETEAAAYVGESGPQPGAAFFDGGLASITGKIAIGTRGQDGHVWLQVN